MINYLNSILIHHKTQKKYKIKMLTAIKIGISLNFFLLLLKYNKL